jgi:hypothetical protein
MIKLRIETDFAGPTMTELAGLIDTASEGQIEVRWTGTKQDTRLLRTYKHLPITLVVPDLVAMERAAAYLGLSLLLDNNLLDKAAGSLTDRHATDWGAFTRGVTPPVALGIITHLSAVSLRRGVKPNICRVVSDCLFEGVSPVDADVLLSLMAQGATR